MTRLLVIVDYYVTRSISVGGDQSPILNQSLFEESADENVFVGPDEDDESNEEEGEEEEGLEKIEEK